MKETKIKNPEPSLSNFVNDYRKMFASQNVRQSVLGVSGVAVFYGGYLLLRMCDNIIASILKAICIYIWFVGGAFLIFKAVSPFISRLVIPSLIMLFEVVILSLRGAQVMFDEIVEHLLGNEVKHSDD